MTQHRIIVLKAAATHEAWVLENGTHLAMELDPPRQGYLVCMATAESIEILTSHTSEREAIDQCAAIADRLDELNAFGRVTMQ